MKSLPIFLLTCLIIACKPKPPAQQQPVKPAVAKPQQQNRQTNPGHAQEHHSNMTFVAYNDDGDNYVLIAQKNNRIFNFINDSDTSRNLNRGDGIEVKWKNGTVTIAGDGETPVPAEIITSVKKISDGAVSKFRKTYGRQIKYTWPTNENFSQSYLDRLYTLVEHYLANTSNALLRLAINKQQQITYSIEPTQKNNRDYTMIGIAPVNDAHSSPVVQWLYIDTENHKLFEYDLPNDELVELTY